MAFWDEINKAFLGSPAQTNQYPTMSPQQLGWANQSGQQASQGLANTNLSFDPIKQQSLHRFNTQTVPGLLERFQTFRNDDNGMGSALGGQLAGAGQELEGQLAGQESMYNLNKHQALLQQLGIGLRPQFDTERTGAEPGFLQQFLGASAQQLPKYLFGGGQQTQSSTGFGSQEAGGGMGNLSPENIQSLIKLASMIGRFI